MKKRVEKIFSNNSEQLDAILIKNSAEPYIDYNFFYVTGLTQGLFEGSIAICYPSGEIDLIVSQLEEEVAQRSGTNLLVYKKTQEYNDFLLERLRNLKKIGLNYSGIPHDTFVDLGKKLPNCDFYDISQALIKTRMIKEPEEIDLLRNAAEIVDNVVASIPEKVHEGMKEYELAAEINYLMQKNGADGPAFDTISSFGRNSAMPHYSHGDTVLKNGDFVLCDFGANYKKYNSDITRTFVYGTSVDKQKKMFETVYNAQRVGLDKIRAGVRASDVHNAVAGFIDSTDFKGCFIHSTGHSLGLAVHDPGVGFREDSDIVLEENMVLTVEPGVYIPGFGGVRIEDDIVVKNDGFDFLTKSSREFLEI